MSTKTTSAYAIARREDALGQALGVPRHEGPRDPVGGEELELWLAHALVS